MGSWSSEMISSYSENIGIDRWSDLSGLAEAFFLQSSKKEYKKGIFRNYIFRGQPSSKYELKPSIGREYMCKYDGQYVIEDYCQEKEKEAFEHFKRAAMPYVGYTELNDWAWLALAQHHGMPTRLLDWSTSIFNAAYFAIYESSIEGGHDRSDIEPCSVKDNDKSFDVDNPIIFYASELPIVKCKESPDPFGIKEAHVFCPPHISPRIPAQSALFTVHPEPQHQFEHEYLGKISIKKSECFNIKQLLDSIAINEASLFPGIDGLSRHLGWKYRDLKFTGSGDRLR